MSKAKPALPDSAKLNYTTIDGVPTIQIEASLTTRAQVNAMLNQLGKLGDMLPEAKARKAAKKTAARKTGNANTNVQPS